MQQALTDTCLSHTGAMQCPIFNTLLVEKTQFLLILEKEVFIVKMRTSPLKCNSPFLAKREILNSVLMVDLFIEGQVPTEMDKGEESLEKEGGDISKSTI